MNTTTRPPMLFDKVLDLGYCPMSGETRDELSEDFPSWIWRQPADFVAMTEARRLIVTVYVDDDGLHAFVFDTHGVLQTEPLSFGADPIGAELFLASLAVLVKL